MASASKSARIGRVLGVVALAGAALAAAPSARAGAITVDNYSFESPFTTQAQRATPSIDQWQTQSPDLVEVLPGVFIPAGVGVFPNTNPSSPDYIDNMDQRQGAFLQSDTGNEAAQQLRATYLAGQSYTLTVGVARSYGSPPSATDALRLALFYVGTDGQRHFLATHDVVNDAATALSPNHFNDFTVSTPQLVTGDPAVGQPISILIASQGAADGYFDADNVRVTGVPEPTGVALVGVAAVSLAGRRRRWRRAVAFAERG